MGIRIGILGAGATVAVADQHAAAFLAQGARCAITAVCSRAMDSCLRLCTRHGLTGALQTTSPDEFWDAVDAAVVCTPNHLHLEHALAALRRGKGVLLEKPLGLSFAAPGAVEELLSLGRGRAMVGYVYRYAAPVLRLRQLLKERMGRIYLLEAVQGGLRLANPALPLEWRMRRDRSGSGALGDFGSHLLDLVRYAAGVEVEQAAGCGGIFLPQRGPDRDGRTQVENDDAFVFCGRGSGGTLCSFSVSRVGLDGIHLCISGEGGLVRLAVEQGQLCFWPKAPDGGYAPEALPAEDWSEPPQRRFDRQADAFLSLLEGRPAEVCSLEEAVRTERLLLELEQTAWQQGRRAPLPLK